MELPRPLQTGRTNEQIMEALLHYLRLDNPHEVTAAQIGAVTDVLMNGATIVTGGVAIIPLAQGTSAGVVKIPSNGTLTFDGSGNLIVSMAALSQIKEASSQTRCISPYHQHEAVFYGLARAAGDTTQSSTAGAVGTYTEQAKTAIRNMIGSAAASDLTAHTGATNNPHAVTAEQVGAYTKEYINGKIEHGVVVDNGTDFNTLTDVGIYRVTSNAAGESMVNIPTKCAGVLFTFSAYSIDSTRINQVWIPHYYSLDDTAYNVFIRQKASNGWYDWCKLGDTTPTKLADGTDLNDLPTRDAEYFSNSAASSATMLNTPFTTASFRLEVKRIIASRVFQILYPNDNAGNCYYQRALGASGWSSWYKFEGTVVS